MEIPHPGSGEIRTARENWDERSHAGIKFDQRRVDFGVPLYFLREATGGGYNIIDNCNVFADRVEPDEDVDFVAGGFVGGGDGGVVTARSWLLGKR